MAEEIDLTDDLTYHTRRLADLRAAIVELCRTGGQRTVAIGGVSFSYGDLNTLREMEAESLAFIRSYGKRGYCLSYRLNMA